MNRYDRCLHGCTMPTILRQVAEGQELNEYQREYIKDKLEWDAKRAKQDAIMRKERKERFKREIMEILRIAPTSGFTATDVQFLIRDFIDRRITNQKVAAYVNDMVHNGEIKRANVNSDHMAVFFCGDKLEELYCRKPLCYIHNIYSA